MTRRVAYLLKKFPRLSETFVLTEILAQERLALDVHVFSRRAPDAEPRHATLSELRALVETLPNEIDPWRELVATSADTADLLQRLRAVHAQFAAVVPAKFSALLAEATWLLRRTRELAIEHVHVHFATDSAVVAMLLRALGGPSYSVTAHAKDIYRETVAPALLRAIAEHAEFVVTVCDANVAFLRELIGERACRKVRRLYNGIDLERFRSIERRPMPGRVLSIGRLVEKKGFDVLVDALALLARRGVHVDAEIAGDGEDRARIEQRIREYGLGERVRLLGPLPQERVRERFAEASVFALPCKVGDDGNRDALPTVLLEAQAAGVACVSTPVGGVAEILDGGRAGLLVPEADVARTADAIARLLDDTVLRAEIERAGVQRAAELFDVARQSRVLRAWFEAAIGEARTTCASPA
jgi:glycosyltransferase involved in cell wall biosynthesis